MVRRITERADAVAALAEVFRECGFEGASLARITAATGLGKGSLYHFFPGGKDEMGQAVLAHVDAWFESEVFAPLRDAADPAGGIRHMLRATRDYFQSGRRVCLVGVFALGGERDRYASQVHAYFHEWNRVLRCALRRLGHAPGAARALAEGTLAEIQGALVLARAWDEPAAFARAMERCQARLLGAPD